MSIQPYQEYIRSGVEWLGEIPSTWTIKRLGYFFDERREKVSDKDYQPLSVTKNGVVPQLETAAKSDDGDNRKKVCSGDFVINSRSDRKGSSGASPLNGSVSLINTVIVPKKNIDIKFAHYLFRSTSFQEEYYRFGKGIVADLWSTNYSEMKNILIPVPLLIEQNKIAEFLDEQTAKIDMLVAEQEKLIELLKEKRQAVISNAVTKGLNPKVKMKNSGVEWLGDIPEHWEIKKIKWCLKLKNEKTQERSNTIALENIEGWTGRFIDTESEFEGDGVKFDEGDILFGKLRPYLAKVFRAKVSGEAMGDFFVLEPKQNLLSQFAERLLISSEFIDAINSSTYGTKMPRVNWEYFSSMLIPVPPKDEQILISNYLLTANKEMDDLIATSNNAIALLQERRSALISAAVTGQIDVRNYQAEEVA